MMAFTFSFHLGDLFLGSKPSVFNRSDLPRLTYPQTSGLRARESCLHFWYPIRALI